ncbi:MAG: primosomal protein N' [Actinomycetaceae bacterium]|nr:primosomal protein N' [Actinomycetaceae bacterium]
MEEREQLLQLPILHTPVDHTGESSVARVLLISGPRFLTEPLDYLLPKELEGKAIPGVLVKVPLKTAKHLGYLVECIKKEGHDPRLRPIASVVTDLPIMTPEVYKLSRAVARHYAGLTRDVLRTAIPAANKTAEKKLRQLAWGAQFPQYQLDAHDWSDYTGGEAFLTRLRLGQSPRAVWSVLPRLATGNSMLSPGVEAWMHWVTQAAKATLISKRNVLIVVATTAQAWELMAAFSQALPEEPVEVLSSSLSPAKRYTSFLSVLKGQTRVVIGTRSAAFAPLENIGLIVIWDDSDSNHTEAKAPYFNARTVLVHRASELRSALLIAGHSVSIEAQRLLSTGWAAPLVAPRPLLRQLTPRFHIESATDIEQSGPRGHITSQAHTLIQRALEEGPVLVHVPFSGYVNVLRCGICQAPASCSRCAGPLKGTPSKPQCSWCGALATTYTCRQCSQSKLRALRIGAGRIGEELGRAFPKIPVLVSNSVDGIIADVDAQPRLVVATPGAEPRAGDGYRAGLVLQAPAIAYRPELWAETEAMRRWLRVGSLLQPKAPLFITGGVPQRLGQALVRWDPFGFAQALLEERQELGFPPTMRLASLTGERATVVGIAEALKDKVKDLEILGPTALPSPSGTMSRVILRSTLVNGDSLTAALQAQLRTVRSSRGLKVEVDPPTLW